MAGGGYRVEAERWLTIAEKLLSAQDLRGAKSFAIRARESDPRLFEFADQIITVADTLLAGELRIDNGNHDYYAILQLGRLTQSMELVASQYRKLALILNPTRNKLMFADQALRLVSESWFVFANPSKKAMYDHELQLSQLGKLGPYGLSNHQLGQPSQSETSQAQVKRSPIPHFDEAAAAVARPSVSTPIWQTRQPAPPKPTESLRPAPPQLRPTDSHRPPAPPKSAESSCATTSTQQPDEVESVHRSRSEAQASTAEPQVPNFWTACPYCFIMYEYPKVYEECALKCQNCKRAFHAAVIPAPPENGNDQYFCCWAFFPLGFSGKARDLKKIAWSPFSAKFTTPLQAGGVKQAKPKVIYKDDVYIDLSDPSEDESDSDDDDWSNNKRKVKNVRGRATPSKTVKKSQNERPKKQNAEGRGNVQEEVVGMGEGTSGRKRKRAKDLGKLDLNVMFSNEVEETVPAASQGHRSGNEEDDNIAGIGFFEGLDEFLSSLPILSVVGDDKDKAS